MASTISLEGIQSIGGNEDRALAILKVDYNNIIYNWQVFVPKDTTNLEQFLVDIQSYVEAEIDAKEAEWTALDPKTREYEDPFTQEITIVDIQKEEIVKPDIPDYYSKRRSQYPSIGEQIGALWKGEGSDDYYTMMDKIISVKETNPKPSFGIDLAEQQNRVLDEIIYYTQKRLDTFARTRNYDNIVSACTYENSPVQKFQIEGSYCVQMRSQTWATLYTILDEVQQEIRPLPSGYSDIEAELPALVWPN